MTDVPGFTDAIPPELRPSLEQFVERFDADYGLDSVADDLWPDILKTAAVSEFAANVLLRQWPAISHDSFLTLSDSALLDDLTETLLCDDEEDAPDASRALRLFRHRFMFRILFLELSGRAGTVDTLASLSLLADRLLDIAMRLAHRRVKNRFGELLDSTGRPIPLVTLGMGKLGGGELNFSSDIDLIFLFPEKGESDGHRALSAQEYCLRWSQQVITLLDKKTVDGFVFRVDTRLRPFGDSGPPVTSFQALETYLVNHGRAWERYAYVKAGIVGTDPGPDVREALFDECIHPFVYRGYVDFGLFESLREMHGLIDAERRGLTNNIKLGPGGIREVEFIVQSLQMLRGGAMPELQTRSLRSALSELAGFRELSRQVADDLDHAYLFMRKLENLLQARSDRQTHELPASPAGRAAAALGMGFPDWPALEPVLKRHRDVVSRQFREVAHVGRDDESPRDLLTLWESGAAAPAWAEALSEFDDASALAERIVSFRDVSRRSRPDAEASKRIAVFLPTLLEVLPEVDQPLKSLDRVLSIVEQVLKRSAYIALLNENPDCTRRLLELTGRSALIARQLARYPVLLDELLDPDVGFEGLSRENLARELEARLDMVDDDDVEERIEALARFQRISVFRIALADLGAGLPLMRASDSLTWLAEVVVESALQMAADDTCRRHGQPSFIDGGEPQRAGFGVVAYGKLGGIELSYGSDLDLVFLHGSRGQQQMTDGEKPIENSVFFARLIRRLVHILTTRTSSGVLYEIDTRLRPSGRSGLLVTSLDAFDRYQREEAWTWEHQALLRARPVAGDDDVLERFNRIRAHALTAYVRPERIQKDVVEMRRKMRRELDRSGAGVFDLKQGEGGIGDIEFIVQYLVLREASRHASLIEFTDNIRQLDALGDCGILERELAHQLQDIYRRYRLFLHHRLLDDGDSLVPDTEFEPERQSVTAAWQQIFDAE